MRGQQKKEKYAGGAVVAIVERDIDSLTALRCAL
jgi:hypothetical protein